ncbi:MAG TPA: acetylxylan esterase, partial [bacterium]|nr:acetylxylan esterase [bacterium]
MKYGKTSDYQGIRGLLTLELAVFVLIGWLSTNIVLAQDEDLNVISGQQGKTIWMQYTDAPNALYHHLMLESYSLLDQREQQIATLETRDDWKQRQQKVREILQRIVGPFPDRTPLNPVITGTLKKPGYTMEKIIFESRPGFHVTAALFLPENRQGRTPAILYTPGHSATGFRTGQRTIVNLVRKGFIVFAIDPVGQGERLQYYDPKVGVSRIGSPTHEHSYPGAQCFLSGSSMARYEIWDGIRAIDYLISRSEVDPDRIGIHGVSGGGTQSAYIAAFDDRILAAAPSNYITSFRRLIESIGPQDAEQNFYHGLAEGIDHADLLEVRAPKPALVMATTRDFFSIQGVRETVAEARRIYEAYEASENLETVEDDLG